MRRASLSTVALLVVSSPAPGASQAGGDDWVFAGVSFPPQLDTFVVRGINRWPGSPEAGIVIHYVAPHERSASFDVYVYPVTSPALADDDSAAVSAEYQKSMGSVLQYNEQQEGVTVEVEEEGPWTGGAAAGLHARYTLRRGSQSRESRLLVFVRDGYYMKFRLTYERAVRMLLADHVEGFVSEALESVLASPRPQDG